jgi:hypothetical protein
MNRRHVLAAAFGVASGLAGCLSGDGDGAGGESTTETEPRTTVRATGDGVAANFRVVDGHEPTADAAGATFDGGTVTVTGTGDPTGCNRPTLSSVQYNSLGRVVVLTVGETSPYGETATVVCGNASYDYRCEVTVDADEDPPEAVDLLHHYDGKENRSFDLTRG